MSLLGLASSRATVSKLALAFAIGAGTLLSEGVQAKTATDDGPAVVALASLPPEAQKTTVLIRRGGPFPYAKDGTVFGNRERLLPRRPRGHYREYTVRTPGARDRGARRIVCGGSRPAEPEVCYYTADHYASFARIAP